MTAMRKVIYCLLCGRIKDKNSAVFTIKFQVCCMSNTAQWLANTVQLILISLTLYSKQPMKLK